MRLLLGFFAIVLPLSVQAYLPPPGSLLGAMLDPDIDPLVLDQLMEEEPATETEEVIEDSTWAEDAAAWEAENDPLVLDQEIFDENGNWIDVMDVLGGMADDAATSAPAPEATHQAAPVQTQSAAPAMEETGKPVLYRGGKVFEPGANTHAAAATSSMPEQSAVNDTEAPPPAEEGADTIPEGADVESDATTEDTASASGAVIEDEAALSATGATASEETSGIDAENDDAVMPEEKGGSWLGGSMMTIALAAGAIGLGVMLLLFKGKVTGGTKGKAPVDAAAAPAAPAPEESKLQQAIDEMRGKQ